KRRGNSRTVRLPDRSGARSRRFKRDTALRRRKSPNDRRGDDDRDGRNREKRSPMRRANGPGPRPTFVPLQQGAANDKDAAEGSQIDPFRELERQVLDETRWTDRASGRLDGRPISGGQHEQKESVQQDQGPNEPGHPGPPHFLRRNLGRFRR